MRIWVTGAAGFVGHRLCARLAADGHVATGVDREVEITDAPRVARSVAAARPDAIVHLAAQSSPADSLREPELAARINYLGARAVLEAARREAPAARVLMVTSGAVYGSAEPGAAPFSEDDALSPRTPYASTKACADLLGARYAADGLDVVRARPFNHTGPGQSPQFVVPGIAHQVAAIAAGRAGARLSVGNLASVRDFLDVEDVLDAYLRLIDPRVPAGAYNIASGLGRRIGDVVDALIELAGVRCAIEVDPQRVRPTDGAVGDARRLRKVTGWEPRIPWRETLRRVLAAARAA